jgi:Ni/Co efflux regulator RcnB
MENLMRYSLMAMLVAAALAGPVAARADDGFRCGPRGRIVSVGDRGYEVKKRCGDPDDITSRVEVRKNKVRVGRWINGNFVNVIEERDVEVTIEEWTYDLGETSFIRYVILENGTVVDVKTGDYGRK